MAESAGKPQASKSKTEKAKVEKNRAEKTDTISANTRQYPSISCGKSWGRKAVKIWFNISIEL